MHVVKLLQHHGWQCIKNCLHNSSARCVIACWMQDLVWWIDYFENLYQHQLNIQKSLTLLTINCSGNFRSKFNANENNNSAKRYLTLISLDRLSKLWRSSRHTQLRSRCGATNRNKLNVNALWMIMGMIVMMIEFPKRSRDTFIKKLPKTVSKNEITFLFYRRALYVIFRLAT